MDVNNYIKNNIRWSIKGTPSGALKELINSLEYNKNLVAIRQSSFKKVLKYTHNQESFYIKQYAVRNGLESVKSLFSSSKAQREWDKGNLLLKNNLLTAEPVSVGEKRHFGMLKESYIISRTIPGGMPFKERLVNTKQLSVEHREINKNLLLRKFISYVKMVHEHGFFHGELHAENILVDQNDYTFYLIDVGRIKFRKRLPEPWKIYELARFFYSVLDICTNNEIAELIDNYASNTLTAKDKEIFHKSVFDKIYEIKRRLWNGRTKKCLKDNAVFKITTYGRYTINMRRDGDVNTLVDLINKHILSFKIKSDNVIKSSSKTGITQIRVVNENTESVCIKEYRYPSFLEKIIYSFFRSSARKAWFAAHGILALNFLTPQPIALIEEKRF
ncbi:MAG TPA: lipopolysaccharide kinase InaA family protein, partial [Candidatus Brocadiaceae bacterium]|nr:lipopolysaccharide kinase InaA family protein [Candidatus Brocadiaceae bacterium]